MTQPGSAFAIIKLSFPERPTDRYLSAPCERLIVLGDYVVLAGVIEIPNRWQIAITAGNSLWQTFVKSYKESKSRSLLIRFEQALKELNHLLDEYGANIAEPISIALAVFTKDQIYFSSVSNGHLLLWRRGKIAQITGPHLAADRFGSVTTGNLKTNDWVIVGSNELRELLKLGEVTIIENDDNHRQALEALLADYDPSGYNLLAGVMVEPSLLESYDEITLSRPGKPTVIKALPSPAILFSKLGYRLKKVAQLFRRESASVIPTPSNKPSVEQPETATNAQTTPPRRRRFPSVSLIAGIIVAGLILGGILLIRYEFKRVGQAPKVVTPTIAALIKTTPADQMFAFVEQNLTVDNYRSLSKNDQQIFSQALQAQGITLLGEEAKVGSATAPLIAMDSSKTKLYALDQTGNLWQYKDALTPLTHQANVAGPVDLAVSSDNRLLVSDQAGELWFYAGNDAAPELLTMPPEISQGAKLVASYGSNIYLYQTTTNTIYKVPGFIHDVGNPTALVTSDQLNFGPLADFVIPGDFLGVTQSGVVKSFSKNKAGNINLQYYQDNSAIKLANIDNSQIVVSRGKFVSIYRSSDGQKTNEFALLSDESISAVAVTSDHAVYVAAGKVLYKLSLSL